MFRLAIGLLLMAGLNACIMNEGFEEPYETASASLRLSTRSSETRADDKDGLGTDPYVEYTEDAIDRVSLFFFSSATPDAAPFFVCETKVTAKTATDLTVKIPEDKVNGTNFPGSKAYVYALVNLPEGVTVDVAEGTITYDGNTNIPATLSALQEVWVGDPGFVATASPATFVMRGGATVELKEVDNVKTVSGTILLERLAAKIRLWADIPETLYIDTTTGKTIEEGSADFNEKMQAGKIETWHSIPAGSSVELYLNNLTQRGRIDGYVGSEDDQPDLSHANVDTKAKGARAIADYNSDGFRLNDADKQSRPYVYTHSVPYYSYPNAWLADSPGEQHRTHVVISVPWLRGEGDEREYRECYYSVPVNALTATTDNGKAEKANCLEPNCYYRIKVRIGMLGSANRGEAPEIDASCEVLPWTEADVNVSIRDHRYLVVNQKEWVMNNTSTLEIPFSTSHKTEITECYVTYFRYNDKWGYAENTLATDTQPANNSYCEFDMWVEKAEGKLNDGKNGEGLITDNLYLEYSNLGQTGSTYKWYEKMLYYKKAYFCDPLISDKGGFKYYIGREHPLTFQTSALRIPGNAGTEWEEYNRRYDDIDSVYTYSIDHTRHVIKFNHPLVQWQEHYTTTDKYNSPVYVVDYYIPVMKEGKLQEEFSRCEIVIKIKHEDWDSSVDHLYEETIYITQYPALYVEVSHDYGAMSKKPASDGGYNQYVLVNGNNRQSNNTTATRWDWVNSGQVDEYGGTNKNPNMYVIHTSRLSEDSQYVLGDPRSLYYNNDLQDATMPNKKNVDYNNRWTGSHYLGLGNSNYTVTMASASRIHKQDGDTDKKMNYYYPADETEIGQSGSKENFIAPVFRIASSFGKVSSGLKQEARRRCAVYQEAGRPAGRWRLPTKAELEYIANLSANGIIPVLLGNSAVGDGIGYYWTANGPMSVSSNDNKVKWDVLDPNGNSPRCVYDEWYWNQIDGGEFPVDPNSSTGARLSPVTTTFYWGDVKKDNTQVVPKN